MQQSAMMTISPRVMNSILRLGCEEKLALMLPQRFGEVKGVRYRRADIGRFGLSGGGG